MIHTQDNAHLAKTYDDVIYTSNVFAHAQPTRLYSLAKMKGLEPAPLDTAKVLEIGCSLGGNLVPYAIHYPNSQLVGIDLSENQINLGKQMLQQIGIHNIELVAADISKVSFNIKFDYIICHGVFSWVPEFIRHAILKTIQDYLAPNGIAFISYNTYPGWKIKEISKDLMLFGSDVNLSRMERVDQSFETLNFVQNILERKNSPVAKVIATLFKETREHQKYYIAHEHFENHNNPLYFKDFISEIEKYDLGYLTDSSKPMIYKNFTFQNDEYEQVCRYFNFKLESIEQFIDFIDNCQFRSSIITHRSNLQNHNITNHIEQYSLCHHFYDIYFKYHFSYINETEERKAHWQLHNGIEFLSTPLIDSLFNYLSKQHGTCKVKDIFNYLEKHPEYNEDTVKSCIWVIIHSNGVYLNFSQERQESYGKKPRIVQKLRNFLQFVRSNPGMTNLSDMYYRIIRLDEFILHLAQYLDGTRTIKQLEAQIRRDFESEYLTKSYNGVKVPSQDIDDKEIKELVRKSLDELENSGFFNQY